MPVLDIRTNVSRNDIPKDLVNTLSNEFQKIIGNPIEYINVSVLTDQLIAFGGDGKQPCALVHITAIGKLGVEENKTMSASIAAILEKYFKVPKNRHYIVFHDTAASAVGFNGTTFG